MNIVNIQDIKTKGAKVLSKEASSYLVVNSKADFVITPIEEYKLLSRLREEYEDMIDIEDRDNDEVIPANEFFKTLHEIQDSNLKKCFKRSRKNT